MLRRHCLALAMLPWALISGQGQGTAPDELPAAATSRLHESLAAAAAHARHIWRDTPPVNADGTVNAYIEIARGDRRKWEFDMRRNARGIDRTIPEDVGGYPVHYGFVPQTISYDGDPFDALVLGPAAEAGTIVRGVVVGLMQMEDEKGWDAKVVLSPRGSDGRALHRLTAAERRRIGRYFASYKRHEPGGFSRVPGWGTIADGRSYVDTTHAFFLKCREHAGRSCRVRP